MKQYENNGKDTAFFLFSRQLIKKSYLCKEK